MIRDSDILIRPENYYLASTILICSWNYFGGSVSHSQIRSMINCHSLSVCLLFPKCRSVGIRDGFVWCWIHRIHLFVCM